MPAGSPFTQLCQSAAAPVNSGRADLHMHSTVSDGVYAPAQLVDLARRTGLAAIAVTDHDTLAGFAPAKAAARPGLEVIPAVEISAELEGREFHLLGYFVDPNDQALNEALQRLVDRRVGRFQEMIDLLRQRGVTLTADELPKNTTVLGRRHLAQVLYETGRVGTVREAFQKYLADDKPCFAPKLRLDLEEAIRLVREAGGVTSYAHPRADLDAEGLAKLAGLGLQAIEAVYPGFKKSRTERLRGWARGLGLVITGGSDCHGPDDAKRGVGACTLSAPELAELRSASNRCMKD